MTGTNTKLNVVHWGDAWAALEQYPANYFQHIITDPPYDTEIDVDVLRRICSGNIVMFCSPKSPLLAYPDETLFWIKTPSTKNYSKHCGNFVEEIVVSRNYEAAFNVLHWSQMTGVYDDRLIYPPVHPCEKPLSIVERLVRIYTNPGELVLDPFAGSGTTLRACKNLGRDFIGYEIEKEYVELTNKKLED